MKSDWKLVKLSDVAYMSNLKIEVEKISLDRYISTDNMLQDKLGVEIASKLPNSKKVNFFECGDILFSNIRPYFKKVWFSNFEGGCSADVLVWKSKDLKIITKEFLYYILSSDEFIDYSVRTSKGVKMPRGDKNAMLDYEFLLPSLEEQKYISNFGRNIDEKIAEIFKVNSTLEITVQRIFKSWFVDFDLIHANSKNSVFDNVSSEIQKLFPSELEMTEEGLSPKGWILKKYKDVVDIRDGTHESPKKSEKGQYLITSRHITSGRLDLKSAYLISEEDFIKVNTRSKVEVGDILMTMIGTLGITYMVSDMSTPFAIKNIALFRTSENKEIKYYLYAYFKSSKTQAMLNNFASGTTQKYLSLTLLRNLNILLPPREVLNKYNELTEPMIEKIAINNQQINTLMAIRDLVISRLLSRKISIL